MGYIKSIDVLYCVCNITVTHTSGIHGKDFILDAADISVTFVNCLQLKGSIPVAWNLYRDFSISCFHILTDISVPAVVCILITMIIRLIAKMRVHFPLQHGFKHGTENILEGILHLLSIGWLVFINN